jgi:hypothetical protein
MWRTIVVDGDRNGSHPSSGRGVANGGGSLHPLHGLALM